MHRMDENSSFTEEKETMDQREAFLTAWRNFYPSGKLPDTDFLQFCGCGGDSGSNEHVLERFYLCKERLGNAIYVIKSEGFILKWLLEVLNVKALEQNDSELEKVLDFFFRSTFDQRCRDSHEQEMDDSATVVINDGEEGLEIHTFTGVPLPESEGVNLFKASDLNEESEAISKENEPGFPLRVPELAVSGSQEEIEFHNKQGTSGDESGKLFSRENNEFGEKKSSLHDGINIAEGNKLSANNNTENRSENDVNLTRTCDERIPTGSSDEEETEKMGDETRELQKPAGHKNRPLATVFSPLAKGINKAKLKGKKRLARSGGKHKRSDSHESTTSGDDVDFPNHAESKTFEDLDSEGLVDTAESREKSKDICTANQKDNMAAEGDDSCLAPSCRIEHDRVDFTRQQISENNGVEKEDMNSQEGRCGEGTIEESPDVIIEVVDELISYLEGIEVVSSDDLEGESPHASEGDDYLFGGVIRPRKPLRSRRQLDSVLSAGNVSLMSADSCVSPWAIDVAACEMQSADSSEQEDNASCDSSEARPSEGTSPSLPKVEATKQPATGSPPPVRPPRRSKTEKRSRTSVESPKKLGPIGADDDEVFGKDDKGYEGRYSQFLVTE